MKTKVMIKLYSYDSRMIEKFYFDLLTKNKTGCGKLFSDYGDTFRTSIDSNLIYNLGYDKGISELFTIRTNGDIKSYTLSISNTPSDDLYNEIILKGLYTNKYSIFIMDNSYNGNIECSNYSFFKFFTLFMSFIYDKYIDDISFSIYHLSDISEDNKLLIQHSNNSKHSYDLKDQVVTSFLYDYNLSFDQIYTLYPDLNMRVFNTYLKSIKYTYPICIFNNMNVFMEFLSNLGIGNIKQDSLTKPIEINDMLKGFIHVYENEFITHLI